MLRCDTNYPSTKREGGDPPLDSLLDAYVFESLRQVRQITRDWIHEYNEERPHDSLGKIPPAMFRRQTETARNSTSELCH